MKIRFLLFVQIRGHVAFYPERVDERAEQLDNTGESGYCNELVN